MGGRVVRPLRHNGKGYEGINVIGAVGGGDRERLIRADLGRPSSKPSSLAHACVGAKSGRLAPVCMSFCNSHAGHRILYLFF